MADGRSDSHKSSRFPVYTEIFNYDLLKDKCYDDCFTFVDVERKSKKRGGLLKISLPHFDGDKCNRAWCYEFISAQVTPIYVYDCSCENLPVCGNVTIMTPNKCVEKLCVGLGHTLYVNAPKDALLLNIELRYRWKKPRRCGECNKCPEAVFLQDCPTRVPCPPRCGWNNWDPYSSNSGSDGSGSGNFGNPDGSWGPQSGDHGGCRTCGL